MKDLKQVRVGYPVNYVLSEDAEFDVVRLKNIDGSPYIQIYDDDTGVITDVTPQRYRKMFAGSLAELERMLDAIVARNRELSLADAYEEVEKRLRAYVEALVRPDAASRLQRGRGAPHHKFSGVRA